MAIGKIMMAVGAFRFSIDTLAYQRFERETTYGWPKNERLGQLPLLQGTGPESDTLSLSGNLLPGFKGNAGQIDTLRTQAKLGLPLPVIAGTGVYFGLWVVTSIREGQEVFFSDGVAQKIDFTVNLMQYADLTVKIGNFSVSVSGLLGMLQ